MASLSRALKEDVLYPCVFIGYNLRTNDRSSTISMMILFGPGNEEINYIQIGILKQSLKFDLIPI